MGTSSPNTWAGVVTLFLTDLITPMLTRDIAGRNMNVITHIVINRNLQWPQQEVVRVGRRGMTSHIRNQILGERARGLEVGRGRVRPVPSGVFLLSDFLEEDFPSSPTNDMGFAHKHQDEDSLPTRGGIRFGGQQLFDQVGGHILATVCMRRAHGGTYFGESLTQEGHIAGHLTKI